MRVYKIQLKGLSIACAEEHVRTSASARRDGAAISPICGPSHAMHTTHTLPIYLHHRHTTSSPHTDPAGGLHVCCGMETMPWKGSIEDSKTVA